MSADFDGRRLGLAACGEDVTVYAWVRLLDPERVRVGSHVIIDDFVFLDGGEGVDIGSHVHIASFVSIIGGGRLDIGDHAGLATGTRVITGTDRFDGTGLTGPTVPADLRSVHRGVVRIGAHAVLGANVVVHPDVTIGEGAIVGSGSVVTRDLPPWTVSVGAPARPRGPRPSEVVLRHAETLRRREAG